MRKHIFLAVGALAALMNFSTIAQATDMGARPMPRTPIYTPPKQVSVFNVTGFYAGGTLNYTHADGCSAETEKFFGFSLSANCGGDGFGGGLLAQALYQPQGSIWFVGARATYEWVRARGGGSVALNGPAGCGFCGSIAGTSFKSGIEDPWALDLMVGLTNNSRTAIYVKGGYRAAEVSAAGNGPGVSVKSGGKTHDGWGLGVGIMQDLGNNWSVFAEYDFTRYDAKTHTLSGGGVQLPIKIRPDDAHTGRLGLTYRFNTSG
jgi:opacity protein-like surface antigen